MTDRKDFKRRVRERQARTGESYVTARRHVEAQAATDDTTQAVTDATGATSAAKTSTTTEDAATDAAMDVNTDAMADATAARSPIDVIEAIDATAEGAALGFACPISVLPRVLDQIELRVVLERIRTALIVGGRDAELLRALALNGEAPATLRFAFVDFAPQRQFLRRARAGIGGIGFEGHMLALHVTGRDRAVAVTCAIWRRLRGPAGLLVACLQELAVDDNTIELDVLPR